MATEFEKIAKAIYTSQLIYSDQEIEESYDTLLSIAIAASLESTKRAPISPERVQAMNVLVDWAWASRQQMLDDDFPLRTLGKIDVTHYVNKIYIGPLVLASKKLYKQYKLAQKLAEGVPQYY